MYNLIELHRSEDGQIVFINPACIVCLVLAEGESRISLTTDQYVAVVETPKEIKKRIDQSRLIHSDLDLSETTPAKSLEEMTQQELDQLKKKFLGYDELLPESAQFANFKSIWSWFISERPDVAEVVRLLDQVHQWGYQIEEVEA